MYADQLAGARPGFEINALATFEVNDDVGAALQSVRARLGFYIGGMGAKGQNYHTRLMARMGFEEEALPDPGPLLRGPARGGDRRGAGANSPTRSRSSGLPTASGKRREAWEDSPVTTLMVSGSSRDQLRLARDLLSD